MHKEQELVDFIAESSADGFRYMNYRTGKVIVTNRLKSIFGVNSESDESAFIAQIYPEDVDRVMQTKREAEASRKEEWEVSYRINNGCTWISHRVNQKFDESGELIERCIFFRDITELVEKQIELKYMAYFDSATGVYSRNYFIQRLDHAIQKVPHEHNKIQVLYLDVDDFNVVNDSLGFEVGDEVLIKFSEILSKYISHDVKVGRFNNDEFALALFRAKSDNEILDVYHDIINALKKPVKLSDGSEIFINISAGIARYPDGKTAKELVKCADIAMYNIKQQGKNGMCVFEQKMLNPFFRNAQIEQMLRNSIDNESFFLHYQPQYFSVKKELRGFEALIRWKPYGELISPMEFIPIAEKTGSIISIGNWVLNKAFADFAEWKNKYGYRGVISVNISAVQLKEKNFAQTVIECMKKNGLEATDIEIEITESVLIGDYNEAIRILKELKEEGFRISLDDFGTGFSSLSYLKELPIDTLKIDKSFVDSILTDKSTGIITDAMVAMVKKLGMETIAEGVETEEQYEYLKRINCDNIQGFLLGRPMNQEQIIQLILEENKKKSEKRTYV